MLTNAERKLLGIINEKKLVRRSELKKFIEKFDGISFSVVNSLIERGLVSNLSPLGESSFIMTERGIKALRENP